MSFLHFRAAESLSLSRGLGRRALAAAGGKHSHQHAALAFTTDAASDSEGRRVGCLPARPKALTEGVPGDAVVLTIASASTCAQHLDAAQPDPSSALDQCASGCLSSQASGHHQGVHIVARSSTSSDSSSTDSSSSDSSLDGDAAAVDSAEVNSSTSAAATLVQQHSDSLEDPPQAAATSFPGLSPGWFLWTRRMQPARPALLPPQQGPPRMTLVLDLDQTLIECLHIGHQYESCSPPSFVYTDSQGLKANVWQRPHLMHFLQAVSQHFEVVLFTAAAQRHADAVLGVVDPLRKLVHHRLYGHHTVAAPKWSWVKDLGRLGRDLSKTLIVDDCSMAALFHPANWVSIAPFSHMRPGWRDDCALLDILAFLVDKVLPAQDARQAVQEHYNQAACRPNQLSAAAFRLACSDAEAPSGAAGAPAWGQTGAAVEGAGGAAGLALAAGAGLGALQAPEQCGVETLRRVPTVRNCMALATSG